MRIKRHQDSQRSGPVSGHAIGAPSPTHRSPPPPVKSLYAKQLTAAAHHPAPDPVHSVAVVTAADSAGMRTARAVPGNRKEVLKEPQAGAA